MLLVRLRLVVLCLLLLLPTAVSAKKKSKKAPEEAPAASMIPAEALQAMAWREVGPYRGGRSAAVAGIPQDRNTYYFGATGGGVWKTDDAGRSWNSVSDGYYGGSIGAVAVAELDPNVVYVGGGEKTVRGNVSHGDGMWKSVDAGKTWTHVGLADSRHISRIRVHPRDPDLVYVAAMGHLFGPNEERGVYRSKDGAATWERIHFVNEHAGAVDLVMDPTNPRILYASFWRVLRTPYSLESGGEGSSIWKSVDGGDSWTEITSNPGLPESPIGISGISVSASNPENVYAIVEAEKGGVFRSRDGGETWTRTNEERSLRQRAWYYTRIYADPVDEEAVYVLNVGFHHSKDGGRSFRRIAVPHGDNHDLWIDPNDPLRMIQSNDGGANVSFDGGASWSAQDNQPTAQMYRVSTDNAFPYRLLGGQQDKSAVRIRSRSAFGGAIGEDDWESTAGGESGHIVAKPDDPDIVYGGSYGGFLTRVDHRTGERRSVDVWPDNPMGWGAADLKWRFQWNFPLFFSPHDPNRLYAAAQALFVSENEGQTWTVLSGDLTRDDKEKMGPSGGPITKDNTSVEYYGTIFAALESPHEAGVYWTGSDDGLIHVSRGEGDDGEREWTNVTPPQMPEWTMINSIDAHPFEPGGLYVAGTRYKLDDFKPYLYKTEDWGATWTDISAGIPDDHFTRVLRADPDRRGLLYAGTERGVYVSFDDGASWQSLQLEDDNALPVAPVTDLVVKNQDLVVATQGRGYWILDDLTLLHQLTKEAASASTHLFAPRPTIRLTAGGRSWRTPRNAGKNPPSGVVMHYLLDEATRELIFDEEAETAFHLEILDGEEVIRTFTRKPEPGEKKSDEDDDAIAELTSDVGLNRVVWNLTYPQAEGFPGMILWNGRGSSPKAVPGAYTARLTIGEEVLETPFEIIPDPRSSASQDDYQAQFDFQISVRDKLTEMHEEIGRLRDVKGQLGKLTGRFDDKEAAVPAKAKEMKEALEEVEKTLYQTKNKSRQDPLNFPIRLNDKLSGVLGVASFGDYRPTDQAIAVRDELFKAIDAELEKVRKIWEEELPALEELLRKEAVPFIDVPDEDDE